MHTALAVRHDGLPVGILHQKTWSRAPNLKKVEIIALYQLKKRSHLNGLMH